MPSFIWDYILLIWVKNQPIEAEKVPWADSTPLRPVDWPKSPAWLGLRPSETMLWLRPCVLSVIFICPFCPWIKSYYWWIKPFHPWIKPFHWSIKLFNRWIKPFYRRIKPFYRWRKPIYWWIKPFNPWVKSFYWWIKPFCHLWKKFYLWIKRFFPWIKRFYPWIKIMDETTDKAHGRSLGL